MATDTQERKQQAVAVLQEPRLPFHPAIEQRFNVDKSGWKALTEAIYPSAKTTDSVIMVLSYCKARNLDPFKRPVHIVPMWDSNLRAYVETVWPGIAELRTTAFRTGQYAGCDETEFGPDQTVVFKGQQKKNNQTVAVEKTVTFPSWARITVYREVNGRPAKFVGPKVKWLESYATIGASDLPNDMWEGRPEGQLDKCAEAAALRKAFPEELGNQLTAEEMEGRRVEVMRDVTPQSTEQSQKRQPPPPGPAVDSPSIAPGQDEKPLDSRSEAKSSEAKRAPPPPIEGEVIPPKKETQARRAPPPPQMSADDDLASSDLPRLLKLLEKAVSEEALDDVYATEEAAIANLSDADRDTLNEAYENLITGMRGGRAPADGSKIPANETLPLPAGPRDAYRAQAMAIMQRASTGDQIVNWWQVEEHKALRNSLGIPQVDRKAIVDEGERLRQALGA